MAILIGLTTYIEVIQVTPLVSSFSTSNVILGVSRWQNPGNRFDVSGDGVIDINDYNAIINYINSNGSGALPKNRPVNAPYVDVNGDGIVNNQDANQLLAYLQSKKLIDTTPTTEYSISDFKIQRDLVNPTGVSTVKDVAAYKGIFPTSDYYIYFRDLSTNEFTETTYATTVASRDSLVFVHKDVIIPVHPFTPGCYNDSCVFRLIKSRIAASEILPIRFNKIAGATGAIATTGEGLPMPGTDTSEMPTQPTVAEVTTAEITYVEQITTETTTIITPQVVALDLFPSPCVIIGEIKLICVSTNGDDNPGITYCTAKMTSDVAPAPYIASADSEYSAAYGAWKAFNRTNADESDQWASATTALPHFVQYDFGTGVIINKYAIQERNSANYTGFPSDFTLQGSNDNASWDVLDTRTNISAPGPASWSSYFTFNNGTAYRYYRLNVTAVIGGNTGVNIAELKLICASDGDNNASTSTCTTIMASDNVPIPNVVSASGEYYSEYRSTYYSAWKAFNGTNIGESDRWVSTTSNSPWYIQYDFGAGIPINKYAIQEQNYNGTTVINDVIINEQNYNSDNGFPSDFTLQGSNDAVNWITLDTRVNIAAPGMNNWTPYFTFNNGIAYRYYRLTMAIAGLPQPVVATPDVLDVSIMADDSFTLYLSTDDAVIGTKITGPVGNLKTITNLDINLASGVTNYIHVIAKDTGSAIAGFAGIFEIIGTSFKFENDSQKLDTTELNYWSVSKAGFGTAYETPTRSVDTNRNWANFGVGGQFLTNYAIWTNKGHDFKVYRYFSAKVIPY
jgi:hypothetical protein